MDDMPFGLNQQSTYACLSAGDLDSLGKRAALCYLEHGLPLNDAVVKVAKECPSISTHQIKRVVEFANNHTFSRMFEKQAGDKNIEFPVADPSVVLKELDNGARPSRVETCSDYGSDPVKVAHSDVEHDAILMEAFGYDFTTPGSERTAITTLEKTASGLTVVDRVLVDAPKAESPVDRILKTGMAPMVMAPSQGAPPAETTTQQHPEITHRSNIRAMDRRIEIEKKKQELISMQSKGMQAQGDMGGAPEGSAPPPAAPPAEGAPPPAEAGPAPEGAPPGGEGAVPAEGQPPMAGPPMPPAGPPPGLPGGKPFPMEEQRKMSSALTKQAMNYAKASRPKSDLVLSDLQLGVSLDRIKEASGRSGYEWDNPHRELFEAKQKLARMKDDLERSCGHNHELHKEASSRFHDAVVDHMLSGGNIGEVAHAMGHVHGSDVGSVGALGVVVSGLKKHGFDLTKLQADAIVYEMDKSASARSINPDHPLVQSYADLHKIAQNQVVLDRSLSKLKSKYAEAEELVGKVIARHESASL